MKIPYTGEFWEWGVGLDLPARFVAADYMDLIQPG